MKDLFLEMFLTTRHRNTKCKHSPRRRPLVTMCTACTESRETSFLHKKLHSWLCCKVAYGLFHCCGGGGIIILFLLDELVCLYSVGQRWPVPPWAAFPHIYTECYITQNISSCTSPLNSWLEMIYKFKHPPMHFHCSITEHTHKLSQTNSLYKIFTLLPWQPWRNCSQGNWGVLG